MIIASLTTYPKRFDRLLKTLPYILNQSLYFEQLCIVIDDDLSIEDVKKYEDLKKLDNRIQILKGEKKWKSANKLLTTYKEYSNDIIITCDDDMLYPSNAFKQMYDVWKNNQDCIVAQEINPAYIDLVTVKYLNSFDVMLRQKEFGKYLTMCCLFPPKALENTEAYDYEKFEFITHGNHDELWFWLQTTMKGIYVIGLDYTVSYQIDGVAMPYDDSALTHINGNPKEIEGYIERFNQIYNLPLLQVFNDKPIIFHLEYDNLFAFIGNIQWIWQLYHSMNIQIDLGKTIGKSQMYLLEPTIKKFKWKNIKLNKC